MKWIRISLVRYAKKVRKKLFALWIFSPEWQCFKRLWQTRAAALVYIFQNQVRSKLLFKFVCTCCRYQVCILSVLNAWKISKPTWKCKNVRNVTDCCCTPTVYANLEAWVYITVSYFYWTRKKSYCRMLQIFEMWYR